jgi:hypothetical protein
MSILYPGRVCGTDNSCQHQRALRPCLAEFEPLVIGDESPRHQVQRILLRGKSQPEEVGFPGRYQADPAAIGKVFIALQDRTHEDAAPAREEEPVPVGFDNSGFRHFGLWLLPLCHYRQRFCLGQHRSFLHDGQCISIEGFLYPAAGRDLLRDRRLVDELVAEIQYEENQPEC